jgi:hypothetical protein
VALRSNDALRFCLALGDFRFGFCLSETALMKARDQAFSSARHDSSPAHRRRTQQSIRISS